MANVPHALLDLALDALPKQLRMLHSSKASFDDYVWVFFDGRVLPGKRVAKMDLLQRGMSPERAAAKIETAIKDARKQGRVFSLGLMLVRDEFPALFDRLGGDEAGVAGIRAWVNEPVEAGWFRIAIVSGSNTQLQAVRIDSLNSAGGRSK